MREAQSGMGGLGFRGGELPLADEGGTVRDLGGGLGFLGGRKLPLADGGGNAEMLQHDTAPLSHWGTNAEAHCVDQGCRLQGMEATNTFKGLLRVLSGGGDSCGYFHC
jgi:hypothetical protein